jgi:hypothetical protein
MRCYLAHNTTFSDVCQGNSEFANLTVVRSISNLENEWSRTGLGNNLMVKCRLGLLILSKVG